MSAPGSGTPRRARPPHRFGDPSVIVLSTLAFGLVAAVLLGLSISPWAGAALPPTLLAIAKVISAVRGDTGHGVDD